MEREPQYHRPTDQAPGQQSGEPDGGSVPDKLLDVVFLEVEEVDPFSEDHFVVGDLGTLSERLGPEEAEVVASQSLTRFTRVRAARRLGRIGLH